MRPSPEKATTSALAIHEISFYRMPRLWVDRAWQSACRFLNIYGFSAPLVNRSILDGKGVHDTALAYYNFAEKRVTANLHRLEQRGILDLLEPVFRHELLHKFCPGTLKNLLLINHAVNTVVKDETAASAIGNLFMDMVINLDGHRRGDRTIQEIYSRLWADNPDDAQRIIGRAYEKLYQRQDAASVYARTIIRGSLEPKLEAASEKIAVIIQNSRDSNLLKSARDFAGVLKPLVPAMRGGAVYAISNIKPENFSRTGGHPIPPKGKGDIKELQKRLGGVVFDLRQLEGDNGKNKPCSLPQFKKFLEDSRIKIEDGEADIWYYRDKIGGKVVKVPEVSVYSGALYPYHPTTWRPGDPPEELDMQLSISLGGPRPVPGYTTKRWVKKGGEHIKVGRDYPNLFLWLDGSISMKHPKTGEAEQIEAAMIISKSFLETGKAVRVVTFSGLSDKKKKATYPLFAATNGFITDPDEIDRTIMAYPENGNCTVLPLAEMEKPYRQGGKEKYIVMITDLELHNLTADVVCRLEEILKKSVGGTIFLIGEDKEHPAEVIKETLEKIGFEVVLVANIDELDRHALKLTKKLLEDRA